jgi:hypothetical protein
MRYRRRAQIRQKRVSEQRVRQYSAADIPQTWETFDTTVRPFEVGSSTPSYGKRSGTSPRAPPVALSEPDAQAPPYQEIESSAASLMRVMVGGSTFNSPMLPPILSPEKSSQFLRQDIPRLVIATLPKSRPSNTGTSLLTSQQGVRTPSASTTTSEIVSAFPDAPTSIPSRPGRKTSAGFVTFPQRSVRASALGNVSAGPNEETKNASGSSVINSQWGQRGKQTRSSTNLPATSPSSRDGNSRAVEAIAEEDAELPRYRSGPR